MSLVDRRSDVECWPWKGGSKGQGYGRFKGIGAHRWAVIFSGREIPKGLLVDHVCRNRICVNPAHLRIVTIAVNNTENSKSVGAINKHKTHCKRGHELAGHNLLKIPRGRSCRTCQRSLESEYKKSVSRNAGPNGVRRLTEKTAKQILEQYRTYKYGGSFRSNASALAIKFGVSPNTINSVAKGKSWGRLTLAKAKP